MFRIYILFAFILLTHPSTLKAAENLYVEELVKKAHELSLSSDTQWLKLNHYVPGFLSGYHSQIAGDSFFLAKDGTSDPRAELDATLRAFFSEASASDKHPHALCVYPARFQWLLKMLSIDEQKLPHPKCDALAMYRRKLSAKSVSLVFSSYYINNPSSAFGHTFVRINQERRNELLDHGISYAAVMTTDNVLLYAVYGLAGFFRGTFTNVPYYYKVREYNDYEARDLWSYDLDLTPEEVELLVNHLWELGSTYYRYYYLTQNCSYHILTAIEAAAPRFHLTDQLPFYVIPGDTIRVATATPGFVKKISYRPSIRAQFENRKNTLSAAEIDALSDAIGSTTPERILEPLPPESKSRVLDAAIDYMDFKNPLDIIKQENATAKHKQHLLTLRAEIPIKSHELKIEPDEDELPHLSHGSRRFGLESGTESERGLFTGLQMRFALQDWIDPSIGYPKNAQIEFMNLKVRWDWRIQKIFFDEAALIRVASLSIVDRFNHDRSWHIELGASKILDRNCDRCIAGYVEGGSGYATVLWPTIGLEGYVFIDAESSVSPAFLGSAARIGVGPTAGLIFQFSNRFKALFIASYRYEFFSVFPEIAGVSGNLRYAFSSTLAFNLRAQKKAENREAVAGLMVYF